MRYFSLGPNCNVGYQLVDYGLRGEAGPFDWTACMSIHPYIAVVQGEDFLAGLRPTKHAFRTTMANGRGVEFFHHDVANPVVAETIQRRVRRLRDALKEATLVCTLSLFPGHPDDVVQHLTDLNVLAKMGARTITAVRAVADNFLANSVMACFAGSHEAARIIVPQRDGRDDKALWSILNDRGLK